MRKLLRNQKLYYPLWLLITVNCWSLSTKQKQTNKASIMDKAAFFPAISLTGVQTERSPFRSLVITPWDICSLVFPPCGKSRKWTVDSEAINPISLYRSAGCNGFERYLKSWIYDCFNMWWEFPQLHFFFTAQLTVSIFVAPGSRHILIPKALNGFIARGRVQRQGCYNKDWPTSSLC